MKKVGLSLLLLFMAVVLSQTVAATVAITPGAQYVNYEPGASHELSFLIQGDPGQEFILSTEGELAAFLELSSDSITMNADGAATVKVIFTVPEIDSPGTHSANIMVSEKPQPRPFGMPGGNVQAYAAVMAPIGVFVPCPDKCADLRFSASDADLGKQAFFTIHFVNTGSKDILAADGQVQIFDPQNNVVASIPLTIVQNIAPGASASLNSEWQTEGTLGTYLAKATVNFDEQSRDLQDTFKVGDLLININTFSPTQFYVGDVAPINIGIQSQWGQAINSIYALVEVKDSANNTLVTAETPTLPSIDAWGYNNLNTFLNVGGLPVGNYVAKVILYYEGQTGEKEYPITVANKPVTQETKNKFTLDTGLAAIVLLIVSIVALVYAYARKKSKKFRY